jgi:hypothetical protein
MARSLNERIWAGDRSVIPEVEALYLAGNYPLLSYASMLYSFRDDPECEGKLWKLQDELRSYIIPDFGDESDAQWADQCDTLTTFYVWFADRKDCPDRTRDFFRGRALRMSRDGYRLALPLALSKRPHSYFLLALTYASLTEDVRDRNQALDSVANLADSLVTDDQQKARIFAKLGMLLRRHGGKRSQIRGLYWGIRGVLVWGITLRSRAKALAVLLGVKR